MSDIDRIDLNDDGGIDDVALECRMFRLEQMDKGFWWLAAILHDGTTHSFWLNSKTRATCSYEFQPRNSAEPGRAIWADRTSKAKVDKLEKLRAENERLREAMLDAADDCA